MTNKILKTFISVLSVIVFGTNTTFALTNAPVIDSQTRVVTVGGTDVSDKDYVSILVTAEDSLSGVTINNIKDKSVFTYEYDVDAAGTWGGEFILPTDAPGGWYNVFLNTEESPSRFYYADDTEIKTALEEVSSASVDTIESVLVNWTVTKPVLTVDLQNEYYLNYKSDVNKSNFLYNVLLDMIDGKTLAIGDVTDYFEKAVAVSNLSFGDKEVVKETLDANVLNLTIEDADIFEIAKMYTNLRTIKESDVSKIQNTLRTSGALVKVNSSTKGVMTSVLEEYNDCLELELAGKYASSDKVQINKSLVGKNFTSVEEVQKAFKKALLNSDSSGTGTSSRPSGNNSTSNYSFGNDNNADVPPTEENPSVVTPDTNISFTDVSDDFWAKEYIYSLAENGVINGIGDNKYAPLDNVTREQYLKMLISAFGIECNTDVKLNFSDTMDNEWYSGYIAWAVENGIVNGVGINRFGLGESITREQMAVMTIRMMEKSGYNLTLTDLEFTDLDEISVYAFDSVKKACSCGLIDGFPDGTFAPKGNLNRAQAAKVIYTLVKAGAQNE